MKKLFVVVFSETQDAAKRLQVLPMTISREFSLSQRSDMGYPKYVEYTDYYTVSHEPFGICRFLSSHVEAVRGVPWNMRVSC